LNGEYLSLLSIPYTAVHLCLYNEDVDISLYGGDFCRKYKKFVANYFVGKTLLLERYSVKFFEGWCEVDLIEQV